MQRLRVVALLGVLLCPRLYAQENDGRWIVNGFLGTQFRTEGGTLIDGATIGIGVIAPSRGVAHWGADVAVVQVLAHASIGGERVSSVESSLEAGAMVMADLLRHGEWRLEGGVGAVASVSVGCGHFLRDPPDTVAGSGGCVDRFAHSGMTRIGPRARLLAEWMSPRASFFAAAIASANTVASGSRVAPGFLAGVRAPWR